MSDGIAKGLRGIGWLLLLGGLLVAGGLAIWQFVDLFRSMGVLEKAIVIGIYGGLLLLFVSVLRQRLVERKTDRYKDVEI